MHGGLVRIIASSLFLPYDPAHLFSCPYSTFYSGRAISLSSGIWYGSSLEPLNRSELEFFLIVSCDLLSQYDSASIVSS